MRNVLVPFTVSPAAPPVTGGVRSLQGHVMGTSWSVKLAIVGSRSLSALQAGIEQVLNTIVMQMSTWRRDSAISRFNRARVGTWHELPREFFRVLDYGLQVAEDSVGAFDVTAGVLVDLWGFGPARSYADAHFAPPVTADIENARAACGWQRLVLDRTHRRARQDGIQLDFSAIAKGFAVDQVARYLESSDVENYLVEIGGELRGAGLKPDAQPWWVALEAPHAGGAHQQTLIALHGVSVATSGDYRRYFEKNGVRYCHSIDPRSGFPIRNDIASVTVVHRDCMTADALSTALTVMGLQQGLEYANRRGLAAQFVVRGMHQFAEHRSTAFDAMLQ